NITRTLETLELRNHKEITYERYLQTANVILKGRADLSVGLVPKCRNCRNAENAKTDENVKNAENVKNVKNVKNPKLLKCQN
ncbi:12874_t:CDS:2, partial [Entrophospora sp. SA101]